LALFDIIKLEEEEMPMLNYAGNNHNFSSALNEYNNAYHIATGNHVRATILQKTLPNVENRLSSLVGTAVRDPNLIPWLQQNITTLKTHINAIQNARLACGLPRSINLDALRDSLNAPINWERLALKTAKYVVPIVSLAAGSLFLMSVISKQKTAEDKMKEMEKMFREVIGEKEKCNLS
jgi:hypothetical protein